MRDKAMHICALQKPKPVFFGTQSKLNCEVLWDELAFEVRWAVAGDSVVMQLVSKLGKLPQCSQLNSALLSVLFPNTHIYSFHLQLCPFHEKKNAKLVWISTAPKDGSSNERFS
jgi:hypothetical protein